MTYGIYFFKKKTCNHLFRAQDMRPRDENGNVKWNCCKCQKMFTAHYGLAILGHGKCDGRWDLPNKYIEEKVTQIIHGH